MCLSHPNLCGLCRNVNIDKSNTIRYILIYIKICMHYVNTILEWILVNKRDEICGLGNNRKL